MPIQGEGVMPIQGEGVMPIQGEGVMPIQHILQLSAGRYTTKNRK